VRDRPLPGLAAESLALPPERCNLPPELPELIDGVALNLQAPPECRGVVLGARGGALQPRNLPVGLGALRVRKISFKKIIIYIYTG
jgi:hypothetical protein